MLQIVQYQKTGEIVISEMPKPECIDGGILVESEYSLISAGTEKTSVINAEGSLVARARKQPEQVKLVIDTLKKEGIASTIDRIKSKLDSFKSLGYSAAGRVILSKTTDFTIGDRVACGGAGYAVHSEIITVPRNLAVKLPDNVDFQQASFTTLGSIALQGVRQADIKLGETVAVIGLGLLGQITVQLLRANGCRIIGLDINESLFTRSIESGCDVTFLSNEGSIKQVLSFTRGIGCDAVIITASTSSNEPLELALKIARKKSKVIVVGSISMNVPRSPFYEKELDLRISCSYGPGRYDPNYEEYGLDYPPAFVRWTENRNMQAFVDLLSQRKIDVKQFISHIYKIQEAKKAYDIITGKIIEPFLGILIEYPSRHEKFKTKVESQRVSKKESNISLGFIGAGTFAQNYLLPHLKEMNVSLIGVSTSTSVNAKSVAEKLGFKFSTTDSIEIINSKDTNTIFCASRHDSHSEYVLESLKAKKIIFVEKPLCTNIEELEEIEKQYNLNQGRILVGFNRRFSQPFKDIYDFFVKRNKPLAINYQVNAGMLPLNHWIYRPEQGSGRIIGEVCHFIDCMIYLTNSKPVNVYAIALSSNSNDTFNRDNVVISIKFDDGSIGSIQYFANGDTSYPKEFCQVYCDNSIATMKNFKENEFVRNGKIKSKKYDGKKGHKEEVESFIKSIINGEPMPISFDLIKATTLTTFMINKSLEIGLPIDIN